MNQIEVKLVLATKPDPNFNNGLITLKIHVPQYIWVEILTHRMFARNASSSRAQKPDRHIEMGHYTPDIFYKDLPGMRVGDELDPEQRKIAELIYEKAWADAVNYVEMLKGIGVSREQTNRLLPTNKIMIGIITGTERIWNHFLNLRLAPSADVAMQIFSRKVKDIIENVQWESSLFHIPMDGGSEDVNIAAANIARVSYSGKSIMDDHELAKKLIVDGHLSPFEHICYYGDLETELMGHNVFNVYTDDWGDDCRRWYTYRSFIERNVKWDQIRKLQNKVDKARSIGYNEG